MNPDSTHNHPPESSALPQWIHDAAKQIGTACEDPETVGYRSNNDWANLIARFAPIELERQLAAVRCELALLKGEIK